MVKEVRVEYKQNTVFETVKDKLYNFMLILLLSVYLKHHYFVQLTHLYLTEILFALLTSLLFQILANNESRPICFNIWFEWIFF